MIRDTICGAAGAGPLGRSSAPRRAGPGLEESSTRAATRPIFLVGCVRSGTTLLRLMLDHHPEVAFLHEFEFAVDLIDDRGRFPDLAAFHDYLGCHRIFLDSGLELDRGLDFAGLVDSFLRQKRDRAGKPIVGATVHDHFGRLTRVWPEARFIHLIRDGRDVSRSIVKEGWAGNAYEASKLWMKAEGQWAELARRTPADRRVEVHYEDLVEHPEEALGRLCSFLGVGYDPAMLRYPEDTTYGPPSPALIGQWRDAPADEVALIEARIGDELSRLGYPPSGRPRPRVSPLREAAIHWQHRVGHAAFRCRDLGPGLFLADLIARRAGIGPLRRALAARLHEVERARLR